MMSPDHRTKTRVREKTAASKIGAPRDFRKSRILRPNTSKPKNRFDIIGAMNALTKTSIPAGCRRIEYTVENDIGDQAMVTFDLEYSVNPNCRRGPAIVRAKRILPDAPPFKVVAQTEVAP